MLIKIQTSSDHKSQKTIHFDVFNNYIVLISKYEAVIKEDHTFHCFRICFN